MHANTHTHIHTCIRHGLVMESGLVGLGSLFAARLLSDEQLLPHDAQRIHIDTRSRATPTHGTTLRSGEVDRGPGRTVQNVKNEHETRSPLEQAELL